MRAVMVRYRVHAERAAENEALVRDVYDELARERPADFRYATFVLDDGVSFVHMAVSETQEAGRVLPDLAAFKRFQEGIRDRCEEPPAVVELREVGSYGFDPNGAPKQAG